MRISKIQLYTNKPINNKTEYNAKEAKTYTSNPISFAYQDYSVSFKALPPEEFYETEHNVKYMPETMKRYLHENYEIKRHLPPEQIMARGFRYLALAENIDDAKYIYPDEELFANLKEASLKGRSGILSDIKLAQEMSETPLFRDGSNHLGIYLLKKIFLEGKTMKEINKDFYETDLAPEYRGIVTQPITYGTTSAYGIRYPKTDFWNSFISTRDDYRKLYPRLPRQSKSELQKELAGLTKKTDDTTQKPAVRKFTIKKYQKSQLKQDIKKAKGDEKIIADAIRKRFTKDDPEAAFIVKYLSPIMTIAADKIHLSEEERFFAETKKSNGEKIENFFGQFWKANPELLDQYSTAITDTIELFEENYASGGLIPINNEYRIISDKVENKKVIDYVTPEFIELLDHAESIVPARLKANAAHEALQEEWNKHFLWRYGEVKEKTKPAPPEVEPLKLLEKAAYENNANIYHLNGINGEDLVITANLDETLGDYLRSQFVGFPPKFVKLLINRAIKNPLMTENAKLSFSTLKIADQINDERILGKTERECIINYIMSDMNKELSAASMAATDVLAARSERPEKIYRTLQPYHTQEDTNTYSVAILENASNPQLDKERDELYEKYKKPLVTSEILKISRILMDFILNFDIKFAASEHSVLSSRTEFINVLDSVRTKCNFDKSFRQAVKDRFTNNLQKYPFAKSLLEKSANPAQALAKKEVIIHTLLTSILK